MKKTICLMTNWYPTKVNPFFGLFFKEQAFALEDQFDFIVIHYREYRQILPGRQAEVHLINQERNTTEFDISVHIPLALALSNRMFRSRHLEESPQKLKYTRAKIGQVFEEHFRMIHAVYCVDAQKEAFYAQCVAEALRIPLVVAEHGPVPWPGEKITEVNRRAIAGANRFLAISEDKVRQLMMQNITLPLVTYIGNLVDERQWKLTDRSGRKEKTLLIVAAHSFYKNYDMFIRVMNRLKETTDLPFRVLIVGYGSNEGYAQGIKAFEEQIQSSAFADYAEMIPSVPHALLGDVYARADAFVMTSIQEGQPVSALEAACSGLPIFSTRCGGVEDYVDESMGRIYSISDEEGMAWGLKRFLEGEISFDGKEIRSNIISRFGLDAFRRTFASAFEFGHEETEHE